MDSIAHGRAFVFGWLVLLLAWETGAPFLGFFRGRWRERTRHDGVNFAIGAVNALFNAVVAAGLWLWVSQLAARHGFGLLHRLNLSPWIELGLAVFLLDLWMYWWHRLCHVVPVLWRFHRVHHSDPRMDVSTAYRFHFGEMLASSVARVPVIALVGLSLGQILVFEALMFAVVLLQHANVALPAPVDRVLRWVLVTPFMHKVHHSDWQPETDSNYCSLFSWWDRVFGSYRERPDHAAIRFGLHEFRASDEQSFVALFLNPFKGRSSKNDVAKRGANGNAAAANEEQHENR